ncbi:MFS transporter [Diaphorobacter sp. HDW4A]|uniref:MFS transporter n=1 Tax=Diaphorobacter sp. HDW4A TaxID=2714924 RepID=UPI00140DA1BE|nr:MFS transporter [Diaphorobacter sp. HDW4A]QIL80443.1 MFS transporter [Diaphorobacter sp. HDW4A]
MQRRWPPVLWIGYSMCVGVMGTALASPLYPIYQSEWHLRPSDITHVFVLYMFGVLISLLFLGRLTQRFGFLPILRAGLIVMTTGVMISALAWNVPSFMVARMLIGLASGMITTSASVGMVQASPGKDPRRIAALTTVAMTLGFGIGPLLGGVMAQWIPKPLVTAYIPTMLMGALAVYALFQLRAEPVAQPLDEHDPHATENNTRPLARWMPKMTFPPANGRRQFWLASMGAFSAFGMFSLYSSLAPSFMKELVPWSGPAVSGLSIAMILFLSSAFQYAVRNLQTKSVVLTSESALAVCNVLLMLTIYTGEAWLFIAAVLVTSFGHGLANVGGMGVVAKLTKPAERAGLLSSYLIIGYMGTIVPIMAVGWLADHLGLNPALIIFCSTMALMNIVIGTMVWRTKELPAASY